MDARNEFLPFSISHPGKILRRELEERGIRQKDFAVQIGMQATHLNSLINGKKDISEKIAIKLENALGISSIEWLNMQNKYDYYSAKIEERGEEEAEASRKEEAIGEMLNLEAIYSAFKIQSTSPRQRLCELASIGNINDITNLEINCSGYFKKSEKCQINTKNLRAWLFIAQCVASKSIVDNEYSEGDAEKAASLISSLANSNTLTVSDIKNILNENGIAYAHVAELDKTPVDAYSTMINGRYAIIVTYRHNDMDKLAFDVLHELGHISMHIKNNGQSFIAVDSADKDLKEKEADEFARNYLIPSEIWKKIETVQTNSLNPYVIVNKIAKRAIEYNISPTIAVARYKHDSNDHQHKKYSSPKIRE